jgi:hypothetical protein
MNIIVVGLLKPIQILLKVLGVFAGSILYLQNHVNRTYCVLYIIRQFKFCVTSIYGMRLYENFKYCCPHLGNLFVAHGNA